MTPAVYEIKAVLRIGKASSLKGWATGTGTVSGMAGSGLASERGPYEGGVVCKVWGGVGGEGSTEGGAGDGAAGERSAARGEWPGSDFHRGGLELNTPVWANEMHEFPYLQWQAEVHRAKLKAAYPLAADKIESGAIAGPDDVYARVSRMSVEQGCRRFIPATRL